MKENMPFAKDNIVNYKLLKSGGKQKFYHKS